MERLYSIALKSGIRDTEVKCVTPTYLRALGVANLILVHKKSKFPQMLNNSLELDENDSFITDNPSESGDMNLTGVPLEFPSGFDDSTSNNLAGLLPRHWQKGEMHHMPLTFQEASSLLSQLNMDSVDNKPLKETVWVMCDGKDVRRIVLMGCHVDSSREWFSRSFVSLRDDVSRKDFQSFSDSTVKSHCSFARIAEEEVKTAVMCTYELFGSRNAGENEHSPKNVEGHGSVFLDVAWQNNNFRRNVLKPPLEAITIMDLLVTVGQDTSEAYPLWQQLTFLRQLFGVVSAGGDPVMPDTDLPPDCTEGGSVLERVFQATRSSDRSAQQQQNNDRENLSRDFSETVTNIAAKGRTQLDVTHALWRQLMHCKNVEDLVNSLMTVYNEVKSGHFVPYIDPQNSSKVATELKTLRSADSKLPDLTNLIPLEMLLAIGLETLEKDYLHILLASHVASFEQLDYKEGLTIQDRLTWIHRMHAVVELLLVTQCHLNLPSRSLYPVIISVIKTCAQKVEHYDDLKPTRALSYRHAVCTMDVEELITNNEFSSWRLEVSSKSKSQRATTVVHCSSLPIFPPTLFEPDCDNSLNCSSDLEMESMNSFHCTELKTIANKLG